MAQNNKGFKASVQKLGSHLSGMVMPNIGAFIAWGIITALFIPTGWLPNEELASLVGPMQTYLLPLLIAYSAGNMVHAHRGGVIATVARLFKYDEKTDEQSVELQALLAEKPLDVVIQQVTGLEDLALVAEIQAAVETL